jgi:PAS domain S-box-containing protein
MNDASGTTPAQNSSVWKAVFERAANAIVVVSLETGQVIEWNQATLALFGYTAEQVAGMRLVELQPAIRTQREALRRQLAEAGSLFIDSFPLRRADGSEIQVAIHAVRTSYDGQEAFLAMLQDAAQARDLQTRLATQAMQLRAELTSQADEYLHLKEFFENVIDALPLRLLVLDEDLRIIHANPAYYLQRGVTREQIIGQSVREVFPKELLDEAGLERALQGTLTTGERVWWSGFREQSVGHPERIINIRIDPCRGLEGRACLLISIEDVSERYRQIYERTLLQEVSQAMLSTLDLPRLLHAILTGMTAGGAVGLGFNRAILMLVDNAAGVLKAEMAVGPEDVHQAHTIWSEVTGRYRTLQDFLQDYDRLPPPQDRPLADLVERLVVPLSDVEHLPMSALVSGNTVYVPDARNDARVNSEFATVMDSDEFVVAPLRVGETQIGVAIADNFITHKMIKGSDTHLLTSLANQAALAVERAQLFREAQERAEELARAYEELKAAEQDRLRNERLATVGTVTAAVTHEIRNPLSTIGGFARAILRDPHDTERNRRSAKIIVEEADRLEELLRTVLDFSRPEGVNVQRTRIEPIVESVLELTAEQRERAGIDLSWEAEPDLPELDLDANQIRQVLLNLVKNADEAMPNGGLLALTARLAGNEVALAVSDTGSGIPQGDLSFVFDTFFTTKPTGTGLGLALARKILDAHGARIEVSSLPSQGTTFTVYFPIPPA